MIEALKTSGPDLIALAGVIAISIGLFQISPPLVWLALGVYAIVWGILVGYVRAGRDRPEDPKDPNR